ncbi:MAG: porin family protein [Mesorhizobium sp.]|uniref:outer membrane protein n=1 Tax=Mesorhizobium sp. M7A.F.Ca.ET.027.02.1.1 TaxID=2496655 RepID=UPI000FD486C8|nr:outer membrane beta-barrel protein [Mesorhizobium sp. M7A.F.Ca.ET.027.02.1.1]RVD14718.1 porin family protein [Mesorhizobium sp. M7A.F.Ca.ET.027.02.1.1]RWD09581.1 MAG: porin family protein [Mesorhizobium sp.]
MFIRTSAKSFLLGAVSAVALMSAAHAADVVQPVEEAAGFNWSGLYVGFGVGAGANVHELGGDFIPISLNGIGGEGVYGELTVGYDYMVSPRFLIGGLLDAHVGNIKTTLDITGFDASIKETYGFDAGLRLGYLLTPNTLGYVLGGYSWQKYKLDTNAGFDFDWDQSGYFVGGGIETAINSNWTIKTEYRYTGFGTKDDLLSEAGIVGVPDGLLNLDTSRHTFQIAANYRFGAQNGGGAAFETPAYNWTGFYIGGAGGAGASVHQINVPPLGGLEFNGLGGEGAFGELNVGYDHDFGSWVAGVMVDARYSGMTSKLDLGGGSINVDTDYGFDVLGRVGMKMNESTLAYALAGYSWQHFDLNASDPIGDILDWGSSGFSVGGGLETALSSNVTVGLEYRYSQFAEKDFSSELALPDDTITSKSSFHTVRLGAKYKFN